MDFNRPNLVGMVYPGVVGGINSRITRNSKYFAYSTINSIYVYAQKPIKVVNIIIREDGINTLALAPHNTDLLAVSYGHSGVSIINHKTNSQISQFQAQDSIVSIGWCKEDTQVICFTKYYFRYYIFDVATGNKIKTQVGNFGNIRVLSITRSDPPTMVGGNANGCVTKIVGNKYKSIEYENRGSVYVSSLDPNCETTCLIVWKHSWGLFDISGSEKDLKLIHDVDDLTFSFSSACWSSFIPGQFFTGDSVSGIIRIWNASSDKPIDTLNLHTAGVNQLLDMKSNRLLIGFADGLFGVYDIESRSFVLKNIAGHFNTIFSIRSHPSNDDVIVSGGSEGSICTWSASGMKQIDRITAFESMGTLYSMEVSSGGGVVACGYHNGLIGIYSLQTKVKIFDLKVSESRIVNLSFHPTQPEILLASSDHDTVVACDIQKRETFWRLDNSYHGSYGKFSPHYKGRFVITTKTGSLLIFDDFTSNPITTIDFDYERRDNGKDDGKNNTSNNNNNGNNRVFRSNIFFLAFSPTNKDILLTTDNEGQVILWNMKEKTSDIIFQESGKLRAINFHPTIPNLFATSGYNGIVFLFDLVLKKVLSCFLAHSAPVYSIEMHDLQLITASADSSIKFWSIDNIFQSNIIEGLFSNEREVWLKPLEGLKQLVKLVKRCVKAEKLKFTSSDIIHINDIIKITGKGVQRSMSGSLKETRLIKRAIKSKERMTQNAKLELFMGNPKRYCEYMFTAGDFDLAVAAAPAVSVNFWMEMMKNRIKLLEDESQISDYYLAIGKPEEAIDVLMKAGMTDKAFLVAAAKRQGSFQFKSTDPVKKETIEKPKKEYIDKLFEAPNKWIEYKTASERAKQCLTEGQIYPAAAAYLSVGDVIQCEFCLFKHGQLATAYYIDMMTNTKLQIIRDRFAMCSIRNGFFESLFNQKDLDKAEKERYAIIMLYASIESRSKFYQKIGINSPEDYNEELQSSNLSPVNKLHKLLLVGKINEAIDFYLDTAKEMKIFAEVKEMTQLIEMIDFYGIEDQRYFSVVIFSLYFATYEAVYRGYKRIYNIFQSKLFDLVKLHNFSWADNLVKEIKTLINIASLSKEQTRLYSVGYRFLNPMPLGESYDPTSMYGNMFYLEDSETSITMEEALMWFSLCPFSPLSFREKLYLL